MAIHTLYSLDADDTDDDDDVLLGVVVGAHPGRDPWDSWSRNGGTSLYEHSNSFHQRLAGDGAGGRGGAGAAAAHGGGGTWSTPRASKWAEEVNRLSPWSGGTSVIRAPGGDSSSDEEDDEGAGPTGPRGIAEEEYDGGHGYGREGEEEGAAGAAARWAMEGLRFHGGGDGRRVGDSPWGDDRSHSRSQGGELGRAGRCRYPRHPTRFESKFLELHGNL